MRIGESLLIVVRLSDELSLSKALDSPEEWIAAE